MHALEVLFAFASVIAGAVATLAGFGIGSILTPLLAWNTGTRMAVAVIAIPHFAATLVRFWIVRRSVDRGVLLQFGLASAVGGLIGATLHAQLHSAALSLVFGSLLVFAGFMGMTGLTRKMRFDGKGAWIAGVASGGFGGLVGNQGGIRSAALMGFNLSKESLIATATAIGVIVDLVRLPVYFASQFYLLVSSWRWMLIGCIGVLLGTWIGMRFLRGISENVFRPLLGAFILALGIYMLFPHVDL